MKKNTVIFLAIIFALFSFNLFFLSSQTIYAFDNAIALKQAKSYLSFMGFSREGLIKQLKFDGYSQTEAEYAADNCGADWNEQALKSAKNYLSIMGFSRDGLVKQLKFDGYSQTEAEYAADNCSADWNEQAQKSAKNYLSIMSFSQDSLIRQLEFDGFTHEQALYGVGIKETPDDNKKTDISSKASEALNEAKDVLRYSPKSKDGLISYLKRQDFTQEEAEYAAENCNANWSEQALNEAKDVLRYSPKSKDGLISYLKRQDFTQEEAEYAAENCNASWSELALNEAKDVLRYSPKSKDGLISYLKRQDFTQEEAEYAAENCNANWSELALNEAKDVLSYSPKSDTELESYLIRQGFTQTEAEYAIASINGETAKMEIGDNALNTRSEEFRAIEKAKSYIQYNYSRKKIIDKLVSNGFSKETAEYAANNCDADWNQAAVNKALSYLQYNYSANKIYKKLLDDGFTDDQAKFGVEHCEADWFFIAYNKALSYIKYNYSNEKILNKLKSDGFTDEQAKAAVNCLNNSSCDGINMDLSSVKKQSPTETPPVLMDALNSEENQTNTSQDIIENESNENANEEPVVLEENTMVSNEMVSILDKNMDNIFVLRGLEEKFTTPMTLVYTDVGPSTVVETSNQDGVRNVTLYANADAIHDYTAVTKLYAGNLQNFFISMDVKINDVYPSNQGGCFIGYINESVSANSDEIKTIGLLINKQGGEFYIKERNSDSGEHIPLTEIRDYSLATTKLTLVRFMSQTFAFVNGKYYGQLHDDLTGPFQLLYGIAVFNEGDITECSFDNLFVRKVSN